MLWRIGPLFNSIERATDVHPDERRAVEPKARQRFTTYYAVTTDHKSNVRASMKAEPINFALTHAPHQVLPNASACKYT